MKILVTGSNGQLGSEIKALEQKYSTWNFVFTDVDELNITDPKSVKHFFETEKNITYLINCAAYTAVDKAEDEPELAEKINALAPKLLAEACHLHGVRLIHISTDYVFDGTAHKPYAESDLTNPKSVYGETKKAGEINVLSANKESMVIRTSWLYSRFGHNFIKVMQRFGKERENLNVVFDQIGTPTHAKDLAESILSIIQKNSDKSTTWLSGVYHFSNEGVCSWYDFATEIMNLWQIDCKISPITSDQYPQKAKRPFYSVLNKQKIKDTYGITIPFWRNSLNDYYRLTTEK